MTIAPLHVAIIDAGPGGLCVAQGLQQHRIAVQVYERGAAPEQRRQGYRLRIGHNGQASRQGGRQLYAAQKENPTEEANPCN